MKGNGIFLKEIIKALIMKTIILYAQQQIDEERSIFGLYHILQGRPSIQTIQDARLYHLSALYGVYRKLERKRFVAIVEDLRENGYLRKKEPDYYPLSQKGEGWLARQAAVHEHLYMNGNKYGQQDRIFFNRMQLLIQVWTNMKKGNNQFVPVIENKATAEWVKQFYQRTQTKIDIYLYHLHEELHQLFLPLPDSYPEIFLAQLSSFHHIGETAEQIAIDYQLLKEDIYLMTTNMLHYILRHVERAQEQYPVLHVLMKQLIPEENLTNSAKMTANYLEQDCSAEKVARIRSLKVNTVYDHIVELAMHGHPTVLIQNYIAEEDIERIEQAVLESGSYRLKMIKEVAGEDISYFQIRLALAMMNQSS